MTLLSQYLGYTLSQYLGYSFRFATRGKRSADIVAPLRVFFLAFYALPFPERDREFRDLFLPQTINRFSSQNLLPLL